MTDVLLLQEAFEEVKTRLVFRLENDQRLAKGAGDEVTDAEAQGLYCGYGQHAKELLAMIESMQEPEECGKCETPLLNPERTYRFYCNECGDDRMAL